jgi:hypothetical protein
MVGSTPDIPSPRLRTRRSLCLVPLLAALLALTAFAAPASAVPRSFFGVSAVQPTPADFNRMGDLGIGTVRVEIAWGSVQPKRSSGFNWNAVDQRMRRAATFGVRPQPIVFGSPDYISGGDYGRVVAPVDKKSHRKAWKRFVTAAAQRYGPGGTFWLTSPTLDSKLAPGNWIIWNEQNARNFWHPKASPKEYATLLRLSREALDAAGPGLKITTGGMYGYPKKSTSTPARKFLQKLYKQRGAKKAIDAVSLHPYSSGIGGVKEQVKDARKVIKRADRNAGIVIGEIGWASGGQPKNNFLIKSKSRQRALLERAYRLFLDNRRSWNIRSVYWFTFRDNNEAEVCIWCPKAGLLSQKGKLKPSGKAYRGLIARNTGA